MNSKSQNAEAMTFHDILQCVTTIKISKKKKKKHIQELLFNSLLNIYNVSNIGNHRKF